MFPHVFAFQSDESEISEKDVKTRDFEIQVFQACGRSDLSIFQELHYLFVGFRAEIGQIARGCAE